MILNERKIKILEAIITDYIATAEPIGSRTIAKKYDFGLSSATIRNEMSDLEEMGFITQPHASSGRVPSDKGYRLYVDQLMQQRELDPHEKDFLQQLIIKNIHQIDYFMHETAKAIALLTNCITIASEPQVQRTKIKHIQLLPMDETSIVLVIITDSKLVKNHTIHLEKAPELHELQILSNYLNQNLQNRSLEEMLSKIQELLYENKDEEIKLLLPILQALVEIIQAEDNAAIFTTGVKNILEFPEFNDIGKAKGIFQALEERDLLIELLGNNESSSTDDFKNIQILIGRENTFEQLKDCSLIRTSYRLRGNVIGNIGIIGPTRMNYAQAVSILNNIVNNINVFLQSELIKQEYKSLPGGTERNDKVKQSEGG